MVGASRTISRGQEEGEGKDVPHVGDYLNMGFVPIIVVIARVANMVLGTIFAPYPISVPT